MIYRWTNIEDGRTVRWTKVQGGRSPRWTKVQGGRKLRWTKVHGGRKKSGRKSIRWTKLPAVRSIRVPSSRLLFKKNLLPRSRLHDHLFFSAMSPRARLSVGSAFADVSYNLNFFLVQRHLPPLV